MPLSQLLAGKNPASREVIPTRVLVVDDEALIRWSVCTMLKAAGFDAVAGRSPEEAREIASEWPPPAVALLDVSPDGQGQELIGQLRAIYPTCRFIVMSTAGRTPTSRIDGVWHIHKPFDLAEVLRVVREVLCDGPAVSASSWKESR